MHCSTDERARFFVSYIRGRYHGISLPARNLARIQEIVRIHGRGGKALHEPRRGRLRRATAIFCNAPAFLFNKLHAEIYRERGATD